MDFTRPPAGEVAAPPDHPTTRTYSQLLHLFRWQMDVHIGGNHCAQQHLYQMADGITNR